MQMMQTIPGGSSRDRKRGGLTDPGVADYINDKGNGNDILRCA
jgi:hypothetical protein